MLLNGATSWVALQRKVMSRAKKPNVLTRRPRGKPRPLRATPHKSTNSALPLDQSQLRIKSHLMEICWNCESLSEARRQKWLQTHGWQYSKLTSVQMEFIINILNNSVTSIVTNLKQLRAISFTCFCARCWNDFTTRSPLRAYATQPRPRLLPPVRRRSLGVICEAIWFVTNCCHILSKFRLIRLLLQIKRARDRNSDVFSKTIESIKKIHENT